MPFDTGWSSGTNDRVLRELVRYWRHGYDWFEAQERLNRLPHLRGPIGREGILHCVLYRGSGGGQRPPPKGENPSREEQASLWAEDVAAFFSRR